MLSRLGPRVFCILAVSGLASVPNAIAGEFYLTGTVKASHTGIQKESPNLPAFQLQSLNDRSTIEVAIDGSDHFNQPLDINKFFDTDLLLTFPFPDSDPHFSYEPYKFRPSKYTLTEDNEIVQNYTFVRPASYARHLIELTEGLKSSDNCDAFYDVAARFEDISELSLAKIYDGSAENKFAQLIRAAVIVLGQLNKHRCSYQRTEIAQNAIVNFLNNISIAGLSMGNRASIGNDIAVAVNYSDADAENIVGRLKFGRESLDSLVGDISAVSIDEPAAQFIYASVTFRRKAGDEFEAANAMRQILERDSLRRFSKYKEAVIFDFFLILSGAKINEDDQEYLYDKPLPSDSYFGAAVDPEDLKGWCLINTALAGDEAILRRWTAQRKKTQLRTEIAALRQGTICSPAQGEG